MLQSFCGVWSLIGLVDGNLAGLRTSARANNPAMCCSLPWGLGCYSKCCSALVVGQPTDFLSVANLSRLPLLRIFCPVQSESRGQCFSSGQAMTLLAVILSNRSQRLLISSSHVLQFFPPSVLLTVAVAGLSEANSQECSL